MNVHCVVPILGRCLYGRRVLLLTALGVCSLACTDNGTLFPDAPVLETSGPESPVDEPAVEPEAPAPAPSEVVPEATVSEDLGGADLPLDGELPLPLRPREPAEAPPAAVDEEPQGPVVVEVSPVNGANGVRADAPIVVRFSEPMDRASTEAAYQSEGIPSASVAFEWSEDDTVLSILPGAPLEYGSGTDPELVPARRLSYFISASAASQAGEALSRTYEFSFSLLRQIELTVFAVQNRDLSGSFRSNDTYGGGQCARDQVNMCVGDARVAGASEQSRGFISFELPPLPDSVVEVGAALNLEITGMAGNPFAGLGGLVLEHIRFDAIGADAFSASALDEMGLIASEGGTGTLISADVSSALAADSDAGSLTQYRLRFEDATDDDNASDAILSAWDTQSIDVVYLMP